MYDWSEYERMRKKINIKIIIVFLLFEGMFTAIVFPFYTFYGPFTKVRDMLVGLSCLLGTINLLQRYFLVPKK